MKKKLAGLLVLTSIFLVCMWGLAAADVAQVGGGFYEIELGGGGQYQFI